MWENTLLCIIIGCMTIPIILCIIILFIPRRNDKSLKEDFQVNLNKRILLNKQTLEYSEQLLESIRKLIKIITVVKARTFADTHDLSKVTKAQIVTLAKEVAEDTNKSFHSKIGSYIEDTFFNIEFLTNYIVEISIISTKEIVENMINEYLEDVEI